MLCMESQTAIPSSKWRVFNFQLKTATYAIRFDLTVMILWLLVSTRWRECLATSVAPASSLQTASGATSLTTPSSNVSPTNITSHSTSSNLSPSQHASASLYTTGAQSLYTTGAQSLYTTGTQSLYTTSAQSLYTTGAQSLYTTGTQDLYTTGTQGLITSAPYSSGQGTEAVLPICMLSTILITTTPVTQTTTASGQTTSAPGQSTSAPGQSTSRDLYSASTVSQGRNTSSPSHSPTPTPITTITLLLTSLPSSSNATSSNTGFTAVQMECVTFLPETNITPPTTSSQETTTTTVMFSLTTPQGCDSVSTSCDTGLSSSPMTSSMIFPTGNSEATAVRGTGSQHMSPTPAVSTMHTPIAIPIVIGVIIAGVLAVIVGVSLALVTYAQCTKPTGGRQAVKTIPMDQFYYINENHNVSKAFTMHDIERTIETELSNETELETSSLGDPLSFHYTKPPEGPISAANFQQYVHSLHQHRGKQLEAHFRTLEEYSLSLSSDELHVCCKHSSKDRYTNILPYAHSRVKLKGGPGLDDYINASYIDGYNQINRYIAAQGPMSSTVRDFWRMVWEHSIDIIVMLTRCKENGQSKCEQYWAEKVGVSIEASPFIITTTSFVHRLDYEIRTMALANSEDPSTKPLKLTHYHYTSWPDHGVPHNPSSVVGFVCQIQRAHAQNEGVPLLVHCSAGVGRTGTFILLDAMLKRVRCEGSIDVYGFLKHIRTQRCMLVQTVEQYSFIYDALNEFLICGDTEVVACDLKQKVKEMQTMMADETISGFQKQFQLLEQLTTKQSEDDEDEDEEDMASTLASSQGGLTRVALTHPICFIDGFQQRCAYMALQTPSEGMRDSFWKAVWRYQAKVVVSLGRAHPAYWPQAQGHSVTCGKLEVQHQSTCTQDGGIVKRSLHVSNESTTIEVVQLELAEWPSEGYPHPSSMLGLLEALTKTQLTAPTDCITIHSSDGVAGVTGMFICLSCELDRLKVEGTVDIFQRVKACREQSPAFLKDEGQYEYCYLVLAEYVDSMSEYENFS